MAAQAKSNEQLTAELIQLQNRVQGIADSLETMMPEVKDKIEATEASTQEIAVNLRTLVRALVVAKLATL